MDVRMRLVQAMLLVSLGVAPVAAQTRGLVPADFYKEVTVEDVAMRPQGDMVAFTVMTIVEKENTRHREIWLQPLQNGKTAGAAFRFTSPTANSTQPRWSPDGHAAGFHVEARQGREQHLVCAASARPAVRRSMSTACQASRCGRPTASGSPTSRRRCATPTTTARPTRRTSTRAGSLQTALTKTLDAKRFDGRVITSTRYKSNGTLTWLPHYSTKDVAQIFVVPAEGGTAVQLTRLTYAPSQLTWTPDSATILFAGRSQPG